MHFLGQKILDSQVLYYLSRRGIFYAFVGLDLLRLFVLHTDIPIQNAQFIMQLFEAGGKSIDLSKAQATNWMLILRVLVNLFARPRSADYIYSMRDNV